MSKRKPPEMSGRQYRAVLETLELNPYSAAPVLGIATRQSQRYAAEGDDNAPIPRPVSRLLRMYEKFGIPENPKKP